VRLAVLLLLALAGCKALLNKDFTYEPAPWIDGGTWISGKPPAKDWRVVTFFVPGGERSAANAPRLKALDQEFGPKGIDVIAITRAPVEDAKFFAEKHGASYSIQAKGDAAFERWGIGDPEHAPVYLVDPNGMVLTEGYDDCVEILRERLGSSDQPAGSPEAPPEKIR
jgi:peroxiredoxin